MMWHEEAGARYMYYVLSLAWLLELIHPLALSLVLSLALSLALSRVILALARTLSPSPNFLSFGS